MKRIFVCIIAFIMMAATEACGRGKQNGEPISSQQVIKPSLRPTESERVSEPAQTDSKELVVYFSRSGNTQRVANEIAAQTGADIFEIIPQTPYPDDYNEVVDLAQQEQRDNARPAISGTIENIGEYDVVYIGYPNWWSDMPMILYTFFDSYDLSGKTIAPFCTSGGSGLSDTVSAIQAMEPDADVTDGLHIRDNATEDSAGAVADWLNAAGVSE